MIQDAPGFLCLFLSFPHASDIGSDKNYKTCPTCPRSGNPPGMEKPTMTLGKICKLPWGWGK